MGSDDGSFHPSRGTRSVIMKYNDLEAPFKMWIHLLHEWSLTRSPPCSLVGWLVVILLKEKSWLSGISMGSFEGEVGKLVNGFIGCHV